MTGRTLLAFGMLLLGTLATMPARACGTDDRFACATATPSSESKTSQTGTTSKAQRSTKIRGQKKRVAEKKVARNTARSRILKTSRNASRATAARAEQPAPVKPRRSESRVKPENAGEAEVTRAVEVPAPAETLTANDTAPRSELNVRTEPAVTAPPPTYEIASADTVALVSPPILSTSEFLSPVPTAGAAEIVRVAMPFQPAEAEPAAKTAPVLAANEPATVEFKSDPARLFSTPAASTDRANPRKNTPNGLSWMQAILLALGGGIVAVSMFKLFSVSRANLDAASAAQLPGQSL
jgi:hypothetical protein